MSDRRLHPSSRLPVRRAHRFGQQRPVHVIKLAVKDTVEAKIINEIHGPSDAGPSDAGPSSAGGDESRPSATAQQALSVDMISRLLG